MAYTIKPSIGMLPINDIDKAMLAKGFLKDVTKDKFAELTKIPAQGTTVETPGITEPGMLALCAGKKNENGTVDRNTVKNALNLGGKAATEYLSGDDKKVINNSIEAIISSHANEIQLLRDELYHLKAGLVKTGHAEDTFVADGYIDGFKKANVKYKDKTIGVTNITGNDITQDEATFKEKDWLIVRKNTANEKENNLAKVTKVTDAKVQIDIGPNGISTANSKLLTSLGEYNKGTFSFSKVALNTPGSKENYTMLNDDSKIVKHTMKESNKGYATIIKIPKRCEGFLTAFVANGRSYGNPGPVKCYVIKGNAEYIKTLAKVDAITKAKADGTLKATSAPVRVYSQSEEITFDFTNLSYDPANSNSTLYPEITGEEYCFVIEAENVTAQDYWEIEFGHKKNTTEDLQTNNLSFKFNNKGAVTTTEDSFVEMTNTDMLYMVKTKVKEAESEIPYSVGLYTVSQPIRLSQPITAARARLTLEVNKEGPFVTKAETTVTANNTPIEFYKYDGTTAEQTVIKAGDNLIVDDKIVKVQTSAVDRVTVNKNMFVEKNVPIYRCGYEAQLKTYLMKENAQGVLEKDPASEKLYPLNLVAVIPNGRATSSTISDRLIFEVNYADIFDTQKKPVYFNRAELQIKWSSGLTSDIIQTQLARGNDYVGRIHNLSLAFDKVI